jgi:hypothetical protein
MAEELTESWKDKIYEIKFTEKWFDASDILSIAQESPSIENIRKAFSYVKRSLNTLLQNAEFQEKFKDTINPELDIIEYILYGNTNNPLCVKALMDYGVQAKFDPRRKKTVYMNIQNVLKQLWALHRLSGEWARSQGFFVRKPFGRKFGMDGISETFMQ